MGRFRFLNRNWNRNWHFFQVSGIETGIESTTKFSAGIRIRNGIALVRTRNCIPESESTPDGFGIGIEATI